MPFEWIGHGKEPLSGLVKILPGFYDICWDEPSFLNKGILGFNDFLLVKNGFKTRPVVVLIVLNRDQIFSTNRFKLFPERLLGLNVIINRPWIFVIKWRPEPNADIGVLGLEEFFVLYEVLVMRVSDTLWEVDGYDSGFRKAGFGLGKSVVHELETDVVKGLFGVCYVECTEVIRIFFVVLILFLVLSLQRVPAL